MQVISSIDLVCLFHLTIFLHTVSPVVEEGSPVRQIKCFDVLQEEVWEVGGGICIYHTKLCHVGLILSLVFEQNGTYSFSMILWILQMLRHFQRSSAIQKGARSWCHVSWQLSWPTLLRYPDGVLLPYNALFSCPSLCSSTLIGYTPWG